MTPTNSSTETSSPLGEPNSVSEDAARQRDVKTHMIEIAERMFTERGLDGVSMRDVASAAGQRNNSAVQYHFGSRERLIVAVLRHRMMWIDADRRIRLQEADDTKFGSDVPTLLRVLFEPFVDAIRRSPKPSHYGRFLAKVGPLVGPTIPEIAEMRAPSDDVVARLIEVLDQVPKRTAFLRIDLAMQMFIGALAVHEDRENSDDSIQLADFEQTVAHLYDMVLAALLAPESVSEGTPHS